MIDPKFFYQSLKSIGIDFFVGVPDSLLKSICAYITDHSSNKEHIITANEGAALSLAIGYNIATNKIPLVYMQNSGLGNIINPLLSLADKEVYSIPMLLLVGWRGKPGIKDEPQHVKQGRVTLDLLKTMEIDSYIIEANATNEQAQEILQQALTNAKANSTAVALVVEKDSFANYKLNPATVPNLDLLREQAIKTIIDNIDPNAVVVATTGVASRELFEYRKALKQSHQQDFLTVGGMGHASQIALGIALQHPDKQVFCFDGDGAMLMHMGSLAVNASLGCTNLKYIVFNNGAHDSVGGQATVGYDIDMLALARAIGYQEVLFADTAKTIKNAVQTMQTTTNTSFLEIRVKAGFRKDLGRPTTTPLENKKSLMQFLNN